LRSISAGFGAHTEAQWLALSEPMFRRDAKGWRLHYDPAIAAGFGALTPEIAAAGEAALWAAYDRLECPTLVIRGAESDLLSPETAREMTVRGPRAKCVELASVGHAPTLVQADQVALVEGFLSS
jgi:pimeloyl-ACP methyl ester carboxylesterase